MNSKYDIIVVGASTGGVLAALSAAKSGMRVLLTEETDWIGGQLTSQAVPPDEHKYIESTGCTASYREYRNKVRDYYRNHPYIVDELKTKDFFCPGGSSVSRLAHPPKLALKIFNEMLNDYIESGKLDIWLDTKLISVSASDTAIESVTLITKKSVHTLSASYYLDGTDFGELIKLSGAQYTIGAESKAESGEIHAPIVGNRLDMQPCTWVGAVDYDNNPKADYVMNKPLEYDFFKKLMMPYDKYPVFSMFGPDSSTGKAKQFGFFNGEIDTNGNKMFGLFTYRRIVAAHHFQEGYEPKDITLINWPQNDYFLDNLIESDDDVHNAYMARQMTLGYIYWLQTEAHRLDGHNGYRGMGLRGDVLGTTDGLAKSPYVRECRRLKSMFTITENMISKKTNAQLPHFTDSVGVGSYHIDLHITTRTHSFFFDEAHPFEIPLGAFIPVKMNNLLPACKNIGTTHLTNGCYRLHPIEWNIGEVAGYLAAYSITNKLLPREVYLNQNVFKQFQDLIISQGIQTKWEI